MSISDERQALTLRPIEANDRDWIETYVISAWSAPVIASRGVLHRPASLPGFVAERHGAFAGLVTLHQAGDACEVVTLNSATPSLGVGRALMAAAEQWAREHGCHRFWLLTTNDNTRALRLYQRLGMRIVAIHLGAIDEERRLKPEIPLLGEDGVPIHDEIELAKILR